MPDQFVDPGAEGPRSAETASEASPPAARPVGLRFLAELKRRNLARVALLYLVVCWLILEPIHVVFHMLEVPVWANRLVIVLMMFGFPAVLIFAWVYELTPEGLKPTVAVAHGRSIRRETGRRLDRAIIVVLALALAYFIVDKFWLARHVVAERVATPAAAVAETSIAVLPFTDMSEKQDQGYFADGMAEELLDVLVRIPALKVIGRTSSFQFKGRSEDLRTIGTKLGAAYVVEGSVRKAGARVRVTAQLIDTGSGTHLWADSYDRDFGDVLALQDQIATAIARALQLAVGADGTRTARRLQSTEAYTLYLRGRSAYDRGPAGWREAQNHFEQAFALDPAFVRSAEALVVAYAAEVMDSAVPSDTGWQHVREAADKALRIDANSPLAHAVLGLLHGTYEYDWGAAAAELGKALASNPRDPVALYWSGWLAFGLGRHDEAARLVDSSLSLDPLNPDAYQNRAVIRYLTGDLDGAELAYRKSLEISPAFTENRLYVGEMLLLRGQREAALAEILTATPPDGRDIGLAMVYHALGRKAASDAALARLTREYGALWPQNVAQVYAYRGERDQAFEWLEKAYTARRHALPMFIRSDPLLASLRGDPRYQALLSKMNLAE